MDSLFRELKIYASQGQLYEPVDHDLLLSYKESHDGQILEEGITEAGGLASWTAAATSYSTRGVPMVPFFTFYSMFGFQRVGDLIWAASDAGARGFLMGATAGRTTLLGEGLQHQDGHSHLLASTVPACRSYDPAFAFEMALIVRDGIRRMYPGDGSAGEDVFYYLTIYNENYPMPPMPDGVEQGVLEGLYHWSSAPQVAGPRRRSCSPERRGRRRPRPRQNWPSATASGPSSGRPPATSSCATRPCRWNGGTASTRARHPASRS